MLQNCVNCHTVERFMRTRYTSKELLESVLPRMQSYVNQSIPEAPQLRKAERLMEERGDSRVQIYKAVSEYLAQINLSTSDGDKWTYELKTFPRPKGRATRVVYSEYDLPRKTIQPHDVIVDDKGYAWYSSFGEQFVGRVDTRTGAHKEYPIPLQKPGFPTGALSIRADKDGNFWLGNMYQGAVVRFDPRTETMKIWSLPAEANLDQAQLNMPAPGALHVDGKLWTQNNGFAGVHRLDLATGKWETWEPFKGAKEPHNIYDVIADSQNNVFFTDFRWQHIGRIDAKTGEITLFEVPTKGSNPRRGQMDAQDRLWFGEYRGHKIGMFDTKAGTFKEWPIPTPWSAPYDVALDKNEEAWTGSMLTDRVARLDTKSGAVVEYLLPRQTNIRRVHLDNTTSPATFWIGNNHGASIVKLEPLD
jgi:streptogramin lyase